jgi:hypothetical protein
MQHNGEFNVLRFEMLNPKESMVTGKETTEFFLVMSVSYCTSFDVPGNEGTSEHKTQQYVHWDSLVHTGNPVWTQKRPDVPVYDALATPCLERRSTGQAYLHCSTEKSTE